MASVLPPFSTELAAEIVSLLSDDVVTLSKLCGVSKSLYAFVIPHLYHTYSQLFDNPASETTVYPFLRTIIARPDLAQHVKKIKMHGWEGHEDWHNESTEKKPDEDQDDLQKDPDSVEEEGVDEEIRDYRQRCKRAVQWISQAWPDDADPNGEMQARWLKDVCNREQDAMVALTLALTPNLEMLYFPEIYRPIFLVLVVAMAAKVRPSGNTESANNDAEITGRWQGLAKLRWLRTDSDDGKYGYLGFDDVDQFYLLPSMQAVEVGLANSEYSPGRNEERDRYGFPSPPLLKWQMPPGISSVKQLSFWGSAMNRQTIVPLLRPFAGLEQFYYIYGRIHMYDIHFTPYDLRRALEPHKKTLEVLSCNFDDDWEKMWDELPHNQLYFDGEGLKGFTKLKLLSCSQHSLLGLLHRPYSEIFSEIAEEDILLAPPPGTRAPTLVSTLPASIERLRIGYCDARIVDQLRELVRENTGDEKPFPHLSRVDLIFAEETADEDDIDLAEFENIPGLKVEAQFMDEQERQRIEWWYEDRDSIFGDALQQDLNPNGQWG